MRKGIILGVVLLTLTVLVGATAVASAGRGGATAAEGETQWECWHPEPKPVDPCGRRIRAIHMLSADDGWAVGDAGLLLRWNGETWTRYVAPPGMDLRDVEMLTATDGWAVGYNSYGEATTLHWDGSMWVEEEVPPDVSRLQVVDVLAEDDAWAGGGYPFGGGWIVRWDGDAWSEVTLAEGVSVLDVEMVSATDGWLAANYDGVLRWNGSEFVAQTLPDADAGITEVEVVAADDVWLNGWDGMWHWNGSEWSEVSLPLIEYDSFDAVQMVTADEGWAINGFARSGVYHWNGNNWRLHSKLNARTRTLFMVSGGAGWAGGEAGEIFRWDGNAWQGDADLPLEAVSSVDALSAQDAWAVGNDGVILHYDGDRWSEAPSPTWEILRDVDLLSATEGWAVGDTILEWDGTAWTEADVPAEAGFLWDVEAVSSDAAWAVGGSSMVRWNGAAWEPVSLPSGSEDYDLRGISMAAADDGWAVGAIEGFYDEPLLLRWDGTDWTTVSDPGIADDRLVDVEMVSATDGWISSGSDMYRWNGAAWNEVVLPLPYFHLWDVEMASAEDGWAVGYGGTILHWDGTAWTIADSGTASELFDLAVVSGDVAWVTGWPSSGGGNVLMAWDGSAWSDAGGTTFPESANYWGIAFEPSGTGWAVGDALYSSFGQGVAVRWTGSRWIATTFPYRELLLAVDAAAADDAWAIGREGNAYHWDGTRWTQWPFTGDEVEYYASGVSVIPGGDAWAIDFRELYRWDGSEWVSVPLEGEAVLEDIEVISASEGWIVGDEGAVFRWDGSEWSTVPTVFTDTLSAVSAPTADDVWTLAGSTVYRWDGSEWTTLSLPFAATELAVKAADDAWIVSRSATQGVETRSAHWDGNSWTEVDLPMRGALLLFPQGIAYTPDGTPWMASWGQLLSFSEASQPVLYLPVVWQ